MKFIIVATAIVSTILTASSSVEAHVTANPSIPKGVSAVKPRGLHPWATTIGMVPLEVPITTPEGTVNTTIGSVTWSNGQLLDNMYEDFGLTFKLPEMEGPLYFNVNQRCTNQAWNNWTSIPDANGKTSGFPAAVIKISKTGADDHDHDHDHGNEADPKTTNAATGAATIGLGQVALVGAGLLMAMF
ncbi:hypothetical protein BG011_009287 [Mortierella polycephala]|uniref:YncI copper-binding domain-containing protein n=1 Tax=Mortierella polycephala TaxID=41804 RepID=A0A9P6QAN0_9FUNG|nr:hypothetical protein BG011_009287 [Mortierella polycephala]